MAVKKGQAATEHLVLLAFILIIAVIAAVIFFGRSPDLSDRQITESMAYWSGAYPFSVTEASQPSNGSGTAVYVRLANRAPAFLQFHNITLSWANGSSNNESELIFPNSETSVILIQNASNNCLGRAGAVVQYNVRIVYDQDPLLGKVEEGDKPLAVKCT
jgi:hypothetical protein